MAVKLPNGVIVSIGTSFGSPISVSALSNASPPVATAVGHGLTDGDIVVVTSGWAKLNDRVVKVDQLTADTFSLLNINATSTTSYPAGTGTGSVKEVTAWTQISQVLDVTTSGGEMQFVNYSFLEMDYETQMPTQSSPMVMTMQIADDDSLAGYAALKAAAEARDTRPMRVAFPDGSIIFYNGYVSFNETPSMTKNQLMAVTATFNLLSRPVRYAP